MHPKELKIEDFTYELPDGRIATHPLQERDASKLLIYKQGQIRESVYRDIAAEMPPGSLLVFNQTKVVHARLIFRKATGSIIEVFCLEPHSIYADIQTAMQQQDFVYWNCMVGGASKWKNGMTLELPCPGEGFTLSATIEERGQNGFLLRISWDKQGLSFAEVLQHLGKVPLPPYIQREAELADVNRYQTIFAREEGSVAAPTAGLHFTDHVFAALQQRQVATSFVTLHVGAGTFKPVKAAVMAEHDMHAEWIEVHTDTLHSLLHHLDKGVVAIGTTSLRTLESLYWIGAQLHAGIQPDLEGIAVRQWTPYELATGISAQTALEAILRFLKQKNDTRLVTRTQIIIAPGYRFHIIKGLVTNFHQPQSTLLLLVAAIIGSDWRRIYHHALDNGYRFLSYGDGCLLWLDQ